MRSFWYYWLERVITSLSFLILYQKGIIIKRIRLNYQINVRLLKYIFIIVIEKRSSISKFFGFFAKKDEAETEVFESKKITKESLYKKNHYFLENIYKKLYFIMVNYDEKEIQIYQVINFLIF